MTIEEFVAKHGFTGTPAGERMEADLRDLVTEARAQAIREFLGPGQQPLPPASAPVGSHESEWGGPPHIGLREDCKPCADYVVRVGG